MSLKQKIKELYSSGVSIEDIAKALHMTFQGVVDALGTARHRYYVYHEDNLVYARRGSEERVVAKVCADPQEAHDFVQSIVNPQGRTHQSYGERGFLSDEFQSAISENCRAAVEEAYARAGQ